MQILEDFLPNCLYYGYRHETAGNKFEDGAEKNADEATPACFEGFCELLAGNKFAKDSSYERPQDNTYGAKEKANEDADCTAPHSPFCAAIVLRSPCRNDIVQNGYNDDHNAPNKEELPAEIHLICGLCDPKAGISYRCPREARDNTTDNTYQETEKGYY